MICEGISASLSCCPINDLSLSRELAFTVFSSQLASLRRVGRDNSRRQACQSHASSSIEPPVNARSERAPRRHDGTDGQARRLHCGLACVAIRRTFPATSPARRSWCRLISALDQTFTVDGSKLIEGDESRTVLKPAGNPPGIRVAARGHWRDNDRAQVLVQFVRRNDQTRARLPDFTARRRIESDKMHVTARDEPPRYRHRHSFSSNWLEVVASRR